METILPSPISSAASTVQSSAEPGEKTGSPDTAPPGESRFESVLKRAAAGQDRPEKGRPSAQGGRRAAIAGKEAKTDVSASPSVPAVAWGSVAPAAPDVSGLCAVIASSGPDDAVSANADPVPVLAGAATLAALGDPLLKPLPSGIPPAAADGGEKNAAPAQAPKAGAPLTGSPLPAATASGPNDAVPANADPVPVFAGAATLAALGDPLLKPLPSGIPPAAADGEKNAAPAQAPRVAGPATVSAFPAATAPEPNDAGSARIDGTTVVPANIDPAPEGARGAEGARKRRDDASARNEMKVESVATPPADGNRGVTERSAVPRPVGPASDPGAVRFEEKAFVIIRKSDTSVEVTLAPPGVGKLEIEVVLDKGVVNARIIAADSAGRETIARSLPQIVEALARDGMNVGGFTVSLKERRDRSGDAPADGASADPDARLRSAVPSVAPASAASAGLVDIFV